MYRDTLHLQIKYPVIWSLLVQGGRSVDKPLSQIKTINLKDMKKDKNTLANYTAVYMGAL